MTSLRSAALLRPLLPLLLLLWFSSPLARSDSVPEFLQCLANSNRSFPSDHPISEAIYTPQNSSFSDVLQTYIRNLKFMTPETPKPLLIVAAQHESHVQAAVICAKRHGLEIRIRSSGHDYEGLSYVSSVPFIVLDLFNLRNITIDIASETAWVQAGASTGELYYRIAEKSNVHAFPAGICVTLGAGGHFSGGGYGTLMRKYGLSSDNIVDALLVDANGTVHDRKSMGEDLFWAIRGGGAASFGVVLAWKINLVRVPEKVTVFKVARTLEEGATEIVSQWQEVAADLDDDLFLRVELAVANATGGGGGKTIKATFYALYLGRAEGLVSLLESSFPKLGLQAKDCVEMRWVESHLFWLSMPKGTPVEALLERIPRGKIYLKRKSDYVKKAIPVEGLEEIWKAMKELEVVGMGWNPYGGRMSEIREDETPFPHRKGNIYKIQYTANWFEGGSKVSERYVSAIRALHNVTTSYVSSSPREAFLNYRDIDIGSNRGGGFEAAREYGREYFKDNFARLVSVKTAVDPDNFFKNEQSIPPLPSSTYHNF